MGIYHNMGVKELTQEYENLKNEYETFKNMNLKLDMSRGKPGADQMDLTNPMLDTVTAASGAMMDGIDCRNYGILDGLPKAKELMAGLLGVATDEVILGGSSSLNLMYDAISRAITHGMPGADKPWSMQSDIKFLCPTPGYDRHFAICQYFGIKMIAIDMLPTGPDMDQVEGHVNNDPSVKGIWCVPKYSNPQGITYDKKTVERFARLRPAADDFRIFWDNAYGIHDLDANNPDPLLNIMDECKKTGKEKMLYIFGSTSKTTFAGAGLAAIGGAKVNIDHILESMAIQTIGHNKINQLMHVRFFGNFDGMKEHMKLHAAIIKPKFDTVLEILQQQLGDLNIAWWTAPKGGYFIALDTEDNCAKRVVTLCKEAGVVMTGAGATYPYGYDPRDRNIRIAPTFPPMAELRTATELFCLCTKLATVEKLLATN